MKLKQKTKSVPAFLQYRIPEISQQLIKESIKKVTFDFLGDKYSSDLIFTDGMSGSGFISDMMSEYFHKLYVNDASKAWYIYNKGLFSNLMPMQDINDIIEDMNNLTPVDGWFTKYFSDNGINKATVFSKKNAMKIDAWMLYIIERQNSKIFSTQEANVLKASVMKSGLPFLIYERRVNMHRNVKGHPFYDKNIFIHSIPHSVYINDIHVTNMRIEKHIRLHKGDILYIDPPKDIYDFTNWQNSFVDAIAHYGEVEFNVNEFVRPAQPIKKLYPEKFTSEERLVRYFETLITKSSHKFVFITTDWSLTRHTPSSSIRKMMQKYGRYEKYCTKKKIINKNPNMPLVIEIHALEKD